MMHEDEKLYTKNELFSECVKFTSEDSCLQHCCENLKSHTSNINTFRSAA